MQKESKLIWAIMKTQKFQKTYGTFWKFQKNQRKSWVRRLGWVGGTRGRLGTGSKRVMPLVVARIGLSLATDDPAESKTKSSNDWTNIYRTNLEPRRRCGPYFKIVPRPHRKYFRKFEKIENIFKELKIFKKKWEKYKINKKNWDWSSLIVFGGSAGKWSVVFQVFYRQNGPRLITTDRFRPEMISPVLVDQGEENQ